MPNQPAAMMDLKGSDFCNSSNKPAWFWRIWFIAVAFAVPAGILAGNQIGTIRVAQHRACIERTHDHRSCSNIF